MKRLYTVASLILLTISAKAQIPHFAGTAGDGNLYGYTSIKIRPSINAQESYTTFQHGVTDYVAMGTDIDTYNNSVYLFF